MAGPARVPRSTVFTYENRVITPHTLSIQLPGLPLCSIAKKHLSVAGMTRNKVHENPGAVSKQGFGDTDKTSSADAVKLHVTYVSARSPATCTHNCTERKDPQIGDQRRGLHSVRHTQW